VAGLALGVMSVAMADAPPTALDSRIRRDVFRAAGTRGRRVGRIVSIPGYPAFYFPATALLIAWLRRRGASGSQALTIASIGGWATHRVIKLAIRRRRPRTMRGRGNEYEAFPSGHTTAITAIAVTAANVLARQGLISREAALAFVVLLPLTVGASRVVADEHWPSDVLGGWIGGAGVAALASVAFEHASTDITSPAARRTWHSSSCLSTSSRHRAAEPR
jgi:membrane-associated phospholipid phosphatase